MLESTFHEDWDEIVTKIAKKGHLLPKGGVNWKLVWCQRVDPLLVLVKEIGKYFSLFYQKRRLGQELLPVVLFFRWLFILFGFAVFLAAETLAEI